MKAVFRAGFVALLWTGISHAATPTDEQIHEVLRQRIDVQRRNVGIVVGIIAPDGRRVIARGQMDVRDPHPRPLDGDTVFEIGSITKVFTGLLLSDMVQRGEVRLDDPLQKYLPPTVHSPERNGRQITLIDLVTHSSGLPSTPTNLVRRRPPNPYADYTVENLYEFISTFTPPDDVGSSYRYSNVGAGLLGYLLAKRAGSSYENVIRNRICEPLGLSNTMITLTPELQARLAVGHNLALDPTANWSSSTLPGALAMRSTVNDLLKFIEANLADTQSPLKAAMAASIEARRPTDRKNMEIGLAWQIYTKDGKEIVFHNGKTGGYQSFIGFDRRARIGAVVLSNTAAAQGLDYIGRYILEGRVVQSALQRTAPVLPSAADAPKT